MSKHQRNRSSSPQKKVKGPIPIVLDKSPTKKEQIQMLQTVKEMFDGQIDPDVIQMVLIEKSWIVEEAVEFLSSMVPLSDKPVKTSSLSELDLIAFSLLDTVEPTSEVVKSQQQILDSVETTVASSAVNESLPNQDVVVMTTATNREEKIKSHKNVALTSIAKSSMGSSNNTTTPVKKENRKMKEKTPTHASDHVKKLPQKFIKSHVKGNNSSITPKSMSSNDSRETESSSLGTSMTQVCDAKEDQTKVEIQNGFNFDAFNKFIPQSNSVTEDSLQSYMALYGGSFGLSSEVLNASATCTLTEPLVNHLSHVNTCTSIDKQQTENRQITDADKCGPDDTCHIIHDNYTCKSRPNTCDDNGKDFISSKPILGELSKGHIKKTKGQHAHLNIVKNRDKTLREVTNTQFKKDCDQTKSSHSTIMDDSSIVMAYKHLPVSTSTSVTYDRLKDMMGNTKYETSNTSVNTNCDTTDLKQLSPQAPVFVPQQPGLHCDKLESSSYLGEPFFMMPKGPHFSTPHQRSTTSPRPSTSNRIRPKLPQQLHYGQRYPHVPFPRMPYIPKTMPKISEDGFVRVVNKHAYHHMNNKKVLSPRELLSNYLKEGKLVLVLLRGLPGSGKSHLAREIKGNGIILSTDDYFIQDGIYMFEPNDLPTAHIWNRQRAINAMEAGTNPVIIDNTNTKIWEMKPYAKSALQNGYNIVIMEPDTPWKFKARELQAKNIHGVSKDVIHKMKDRYDKNVTVEQLLSTNTDRSIPTQLKSQGEKTIQPQMVKEEEMNKTLHVLKKGNNNNSVLEKNFDDTGLISDIKRESVEDSEESLQNNQEKVDSNKTNNSCHIKPKTEMTEISQLHLTSDLFWSNPTDTNTSVKPLSPKPKRNKRVRNKSSENSQTDGTTESTDIKVEKSENNCNDFNQNFQSIKKEKDIVLNDSWNMDKLILNPSADDKQISEKIDPVRSIHKVNKESGTNEFHDTVLGPDLINTEGGCDVANTVSIEKQNQFAAEVSETLKESEKKDMEFLDKEGKGDGGDVDKKDLVSLVIDSSGKSDNTSDSASASNSPKPKSRKKRKNRVALIDKELKNKFKSQTWNSFAIDENQNTSIVIPLVSDVKKETIETCDASTHTDGSHLDESKKDFLKTMFVKSRDINELTPIRENSSVNKRVNKLDRGCNTDNILSYLQPNLDFLRNSFPDLSEMSRQEVLEMCHNDVEWAINLILDCDSLSLTSCDKEEIATEMLKLSKSVSLSRSDDTQHAENINATSPTSLFDICRKNIKLYKLETNEIQNDLIRNGMKRLEQIETHGLKRMRSVSQDDVDNDLFKGASGRWINKTIVQNPDYYTSMSYFLNEDRLQCEGVLESTNDLEMLAEYDDSSNDSNEEYVNEIQGQRLTFGNESSSSPLKTSNLQHLEQLTGKCSIDINSEKDFVSTSNSAVTENSSVCVDSINTQNQSKTSNDKAEISLPMVDDIGTELSISLSSDFVHQLEQLFGHIIPAHSKSKSEDQEVFLDLKAAKQIHRCLKSTIANGSIEKKRQLMNDEALARIIQEDEDKKTDNTKRKIKRKNKGVSLGDIIQEELDRQVVREKHLKYLESTGDHIAIATKLKRQKLLEKFPGLEEGLFEEIFQANGYSYEDTDTAIKSVIGPVMTPGAEEEYYKKLIDEAKQKSLLDLLETPSYKQVQHREYQTFDSDDVNYQELRGEANLHHMLRQNCFIKAKEAFQRGMPEVSSFYAQQGHLHSTKVKEANKRASQKILDMRRSEVQDGMTLDLHGFHVDEAISALNKVIAQKERENFLRPERRRTHFFVITGRGLNSRGGVAKIRPAIINFLSSNNFRYAEEKPGFFRIQLRDKNL
ncbi:uncharacterized protein LOC126830144 [Patella vulgata]|uniref:uncharacterized protein LOC126830144 n=1 Tax=Patella vulgata TaxID=6465 RepID=UPI002180231F|nr:uncharacterized protein LOC126830144 [Patella vulgata]